MPEDKFEPLHANESIDDTNDTLTSSQIDMQGSRRESNMSDQLNRLLYKDRQETFDQLGLGNTFTPKAYQDHEFIDGDAEDPHYQIQERQERARESNKEAFEYYQKSQNMKRSHSCDQFQDGSFKIDESSDENNDGEYNYGNSEEDDDDSIPIDLINNKSFQKIVASEYALDEYKEFRALAEQLFEMSHDNTRPLTTLVSMLNSKPRNMKYPIYYERNEDVSFKKIKKF